LLNAENELYTARRAYANAEYDRALAFARTHAGMSQLAAKLGLHKDQFKVTFQSRLGRAKWLEPYTEPTLIEMGIAGVERVDVVCPGFTSDCLETLEEINMEGRHAFLEAGGKEFHYIACLNDDPEWISALCSISQKHMLGWPTLQEPDAAECAVSRDRAIALGAKN
jgi:ferrochelatase